MNSRADVLANLLRVTILDNPYIAHAPTLKQAELLLAPEREVFFGGAVGGGKSDALLMAALQYVQVPGYAAIIFRRTYSDLIQSDGLIPRSQDWLDGTDARWNGSDYSWHFPSGATISFGYMKSDADRYRYKSAAFTRQLWEELTTFSEIQYTYVQSRSRRPAGFPVPIQSFAASNPDGPGAEWVADRFVCPDEETGEPRPELLPPGRRFIPSTLDDNPHLDTDEYDEQLALLDAVTRKQLRFGQWGLTQKGGQFDRSMVDIVEGIPDGLRLTRGWDLAATEPTPGAKDPDWTRGVLWGAKGGEYWVVDMVGAQENPGKVEALLKQTADVDAGEFGANRVTQKIPQDPGQAGKSQVRHLSKLLAGHTVVTSPESGDKLTRAKPWLAACANGNVHLVRGAWNRAWLAECEAFPGSSHDDIPDANSRAFERISAPTGSVGKRPTRRVPRIG